MDHENPFASPTVEATAHTPNKQSGSPVRSFAAVFVGGVVVDYFGTQVINNGIAWLLRISGNTNVLLSLQSTQIQIVFVVCGVLCSFFGGMMAAWIAQRKHVTHALLAVAVAHAMILPQLLLLNGFTRPVFTIVMTTICFAAAIFAGKMVAPSNTQPDDLQSDQETQF